MPAIAQQTATPIPAMGPAQLIELLLKAIPARQPVCIAGDPGIGKTAIVNHVLTDLLKWDSLTTYPATIEPPDLRGMPPINGGAFLPIGEHALALAATRNTGWFFDDLAQGNEDVQKATMHLFHNNKLPQCVSLIAATNERQQKAGVRGMLETVKSRMVTIVKLIPDLDYWLENFALPHGISPMLIAFLKLNPDAFHVFTPTADLTNSPCARTWEHVSHIDSWGMSAETERVSIEGAVGATSGQMYRQFKLAHRSLVDVADILKNPRTAALPKSPGELYAVAVTLARVAKRTNFPAVATYTERLFDSKHGEVSTLIMRTSVKLHPEVVLTDAYIRMQQGKYADILAGQN